MHMNQKWSQQGLLSAEFETPPAKVKVTENGTKW